MRPRVIEQTLLRRNLIGSQGICASNIKQMHTRWFHHDLQLNHNHSHNQTENHTHPDRLGKEKLPSQEEPDQILSPLKRNKSAFSHVKDFFNPHLPISHLQGPNSGSHSQTHGESSLSSLTHSHSHGHLEADRAMLSKEGKRITWIGLGVNSSMAVGKFLGGIYFHSQALLADAVHAVGDLISDVLTLLTVSFSNQVPNKLYPYGFGKVETLGSMLVSSILLYAGVSIGWSSLIEIVGPALPHSIVDTLSSLGHSHSHSHAVSTVVTDEKGSPVTEVADINAAWLALGSVFVKEWLFKATKRVGEKLDSQVLIANAWHHRVDSLTSIVALVTISGGYFLNIYWLDPVGGLLVSMLVIKVGLAGTFQAFKELIDKAVSPTDPRYINIENSINVSLMKHQPELLIKKLDVLPSGTNVVANVTLGVEPSHSSYENVLTLGQVASLSEKLESDLNTQHANLKKVLVTFENAKK
ncbi:BA75_05237T0 [Komagataella pastoris]|uniref:BA75_05237T0 n=1 Tax=Komagataella pastoris TaxID=4922 RepID=A0A1B2JI67_PICPA|nr:BA75_05237T0 [Komagataella pastoris]